MIINQLSIFLNNSLGRLSEVTSLLGSKGINMKAFTLSESSDFGLLRIITDNNDEALVILKEAGYAVSATEVVYVDIHDDAPGALSAILKRLSDAGVSVEYMYAFSTESGAQVVIRSADTQKCDEIICRKG